GRKLILGGVEIPHDKVLAGHSDADVVAHALTDALLGAAGLGDIGRLFPSGDPRFKNADSIKLLSEAFLKVVEAGFTFSYADVTADTAVALGAFLAGRGVLNPWGVFLLTWGANVGGAAAVYALGRRYGRAIFAGPLGRKLLSPETLANIASQYERHGTVGIFL